MKTYEDFQAVVTTGNEGDLRRFIKDLIASHKSSSVYLEAKAGYDYFCKRNTTISNYKKLLYTLSGQAVPDNYSANYKLGNGFFPIFVNQEVSFLLGNGVTFNNDDTKDRLGGSSFDNVLKKAAIKALWGGGAFGFLNFDHVEVFSALEFIPLVGEEDGGIHAGVRFWQIATNKPLRATLFEEDGYTEFIYDTKNPDGRILHEKRAYIEIVQTTAADGSEIIDGRNYAGFPIVPLWASDTRQSELIGLQEKIDCYDLIMSGFANDLDDASQIYWIIHNAGGMDDVDLKKFLERLKVVKAATLDEEGATAEAHTIDVPYAARQTLLNTLRDGLYRDAMALDTDKISAGNITATAINAAYENLSLKCDAFELCVTEFIQGLLALIGVQDEPSYKRSKITNMQEETQMVLSAAQYLDTETVLKHLPFINPDEIKSILDKMTEEEANRYANIEGEEGDGQTTDENGTPA